MLEELKLLAHQRDVPYQSLLKVFLAERLQAERRRRDPVSGRFAGAGASSSPCGGRISIALIQEPLDLFVRIQ